MKRRNFLAASLLAVPGVVGSLSRQEDAAQAGTEIINAGIGGNNTADILARIQKDCLDQKPALTVLMIGTNDMNSKKHIPLNAYRENLYRIIELIRKTKSKILLLNLLPVYEPYLFTRHDPAFYSPQGHRGRLLEMNACIEKTAREYKLSFLNVFHLFETAGNIGLDKSSLIRNEANSNTTDGLHPTGEGYRFLALAVYDAIVYQKLPQTKIVCLGDSITHGDGEPQGQNYPAYLQRLFSSQPSQAHN